MKQQRRGEQRARKCLWATLLKCQLLWIETLTTVTFEQWKEGEHKAVVSYL